MVETDVTTQTPGVQDGRGALAADARGGEVPVTVIAPTRGWAALNLGELWRFRELVYFLTWRNIKVRYKQTAIGAAWALLQPILTMLVFTLLFSRIAHVSSNGVPYPLFSFSGLLPWTVFATALNLAGTSLVSDANLVSKVYFPRLAVPLAAVLAGVVDLVLSFVVLIAMMAVYGLPPTMAVVTLPLFILLTFITTLAVSLWLAALNVKYRDVRYAIPFLTQIWMFLTPVAYASSMIPPRWRLIYGLNPMTGVVEGFRWALLGTEQAPGGLVYVSTGVVLVLLVGGLCYFRRMEREFADVI